MPSLAVGHSLVVCAARQRATGEEVRIGAGDCISSSANPTVPSAVLRYRTYCRVPQVVPVPLVHLHELPPVAVLQVAERLDLGVQDGKKSGKNEQPPG